MSSNTVKVVLATGNKGKRKEYVQLLDGLGISILMLSDFPELGDVEEDGETFEENALKKAREVAKFTGYVTIADDSGLSVQALGGRPGVYSARFAGEAAGDAANNAKLLKELEGIDESERSAAFVCSIALVHPSGRSVTVSGRCEGMITSSPKGEGGFGYDPLFFLPEFGCTMAELSSEVKNGISHRGRAVAELKKIFPSFMNSIDPESKR